jgi:hypothetical protein
VVPPGALDREVVITAFVDETGAIAALRPVGLIFDVAVLVEPPHFSDDPTIALRCFEADLAERRCLVDPYHGMFDNRAAADPALTADFVRPRAPDVGLIIDDTPR